MPRVLRVAVLVAVLASVPVASAQGAVRISQVYGGGGNTGAPLTHDFVELKNTGKTTLDLTGYSLQYAPATGAGWQETDLAGSIPPSSHYLVQEAQGAGGTQGLPTPDAVGTIAMVPTAGKVALVASRTLLTCAAGCGRAPGVVDFVGYGVADDFDGSGPAPAPSSTTADLHVVDACFEEDDNARDFFTGAPGPRNSTNVNVICGDEVTPTISCPTRVLANVGSPAFTATVTASDPEGRIDALQLLDDGTGAALTRQTAQSGSTPASATLTVPTAWAARGAAMVQARDTATGRTALCRVPVRIVDPDVTTPIHEVQGPGTASELTGVVVSVQGIVTADVQGSGGGYDLQTPETEADADPATSEGLFVADTATDVAVGDVVRARGTVTEADGLTELAAVTTAELAAGSPLPVATTLSFPAGDARREALEGMRVTVPEALSVTDTRELDGRSEVGLSAGGVLQAPTDVADPGAPAEAVAAANAARSIVLDHNRTRLFPTPFEFIRPGVTLRRGETTTGLTGVISSSGGSYLIEPSGFATFTSDRNPRPAAPDPVGGDVRLASFDVDGWFLTRGDPTQDHGATTDADLSRQQAKLVAAINGLGADVVALQGIQDTSDEAARLHDGGDPDTALDALVAALNASGGAWAKVPAPAPYTYTDELRNALLYRPAAVTMVGAPGALADPAFARARTTLSQRFEAGSERFVVVAGDFTDRSGVGTAEDADQGQGAFAADRVRQAAALVGYVHRLEQLDPDVVVLGDLHAYAREDPLTTLRAGGLTDLAGSRLTDADRATATTDGAQGQLDHALATLSAAGEVTGIDVWHIDADEPDAFGHAGPGSLDAPTPYAAAAHDPVLVGLATGAPAAKSPEAAAEPSASPRRAPSTSSPGLGRTLRVGVRSLRVRGRTLRVALANANALAVRGRLTVRLAGRTLVRGRYALASRERATVVLKLSGTAPRALARAGQRPRLSITLTGRAANGVARRATATRRLPRR